MQEEEEWTYKAFDNAVNEEKRWADYLFKDGSMIGLNDKLLQQYVEWIAIAVSKRLVSNHNMIMLKRTTQSPGPNTGSPPTDSRSIHKRQRLSPMSSVVSSKMLKKTRSLDSNSDAKST